ncbi:hypothetical protein BDW74DRAFT_180830 [Aspergillus multicolor]|uniref:uncharacterized protein n=1 Tax=Aspergillus multicolor TaxID=41759 RepID=UPI003CCDA812
MKQLIVFLLLLTSCTAQLLPTLPFPWLFCASTTTFSLGGTYTVTSTSTVTSGSSTTTVTAPTSISITQSRTTVYTPTAVTCLSTATTFTATRTVTTTATGISTVTTTPISTRTVTETWVQPTPTSYNGLNYYQYLNDYNYNTDTTGLGGGGYSTSDWNGNLSFYTSGLTRNINFESPNWPTGAPLCQLPGQASATDCSQWTVVFQGFIFARVAGSYIVHSPIASETANWQDNAGHWWGGSKAYASYADSNVDGAAVPIAIQGVDNYVTYTLTAGEFLPFTFIYSNGQGPAANRVDVSAPDGRRYPQDLDIFVPPCVDSAFVP